MVIVGNLKAGKKGGSTNKKGKGQDDYKKG